MFGLLQNIQKSFKRDPEENIDTSSNVKNDKSNDILLNTSALAEKLTGYAKLVSQFAHKHADKLSNTLNENTIIGELERQNQNFQQELRKTSKDSSSDVVLPWEGMPNCDVFRKHILALSLEERNFLSNAPPDEIPQLGYKEVAKKLLETDSRLAEMRYKLVPRRITEENFWKNYFYRISIVKKLVMEKCNEQDISNVTNASNAATSSESLQEDAKSNVAGNESNIHTDASSTIDEDWEKDLLKNIGEFELVDNSGQKSDAEWDAEINAMIAAEIESTGCNQENEKSKSNP